MRGSGVSTASSADAMAASGSYSTAIRSSAAVAISSLTAATAATGSPTKRTLSRARACSSWLTGRMPKGMGRSSPVSTACTPARALALATSIPVMRACGWGLRSSLAYSMRGRNRSSANRVAPVTLAVASTLRRALPTTRSLASPIQGLRCRLGLFTAHACGRQLHRLVDLDVAGTAAQVARERELDLVARGAGSLDEQCFGGEQERRRAVPALRGSQLGERLLQRVQPALPGHPLDGPDAVPFTRDAQHE